MRFFTVVAVLSMTPAYAQNVYLNFRQWEQMPASLRSMYVAGAFDTLSVVTVPEGVNAAKYYNECVSKAGLSTEQLAENMKGYGGTQPDLQNKPVPIALMRYLTSLCGRPPDIVGE
jgi:hypothetical protein